MSEESDVIARSLQPPRRQVAIRRDGEDFVIAFQPEDFIVFRNASASALRRACSFLRWEVVSDTVLEANDPATW
jgi:tRNA threonylcarbamoyladenosine modification (KEOPS) complex  Pcc1 subunit